MPNKNFYFTIINLIKSKSPSAISKELNISKQALNYYLKPLKIDGIIRKIGYGTWEINEDKFNEFIEKTSKKEVKTSPAVTKRVELKEVKNLSNGNLRKILKIYNLDKCLFCNNKKLIEIHHIKKICEGGDNSPNNLIPICPTHHKIIHTFGLTDDMKLRISEYLNFISNKDDIYVDKVRGHAFQFTLKIPKLANWCKRREYLTKKGILFKEIGQGWQGERILIDNFKVWLTPISIVVYFPNFKSFIGETAKDTKNYAIYEFKRIISKLEALLNVSLRINDNYVFKVSRQHYSLIKNALSKQYDKEGKKLYCYTMGGLWFTIDNSYNLHEAETLHPETALTDNEKVQNWFNGLKETPITPQQILKIQYNQATQFEYYAENIKKHTDSIIRLGEGIGIMNKLLKKMDNKLSQTSLRKWV